MNCVWLDLKTKPNWKWAWWKAKILHSVNRRKTSLPCLQQTTVSVLTTSKALIRFSCNITFFCNRQNKDVIYFIGDKRMILAVCKIRKDFNEPRWCRPLREGFCWTARHICRYAHIVDRNLLLELGNFIIVL